MLDIAHELRQRSRRRIGVPPLAATADLLVAGGDTRIALDARGRNKYGCPVVPEPHVAAFGSSTASTISEPAAEAIERLRERLLERMALVPAERVVASQFESVGAELLELYGAGDLAGLEVIFGASGTDLHALAAERMRSGAATPPLAIMIEPAETGGGVAGALAALETAAVPGRDADGMPRAAAQVAGEIEGLTAKAAAAGRRVLLVLVDVSKTGLVAPDLATALALRRRWPDTVRVLVDACQFRLAPATLRAYLEQGFPVMVTGSKFATGPAFSGAMLIPAAAQWLADAPRDVTNCGLLMRWEAALAELRAFRAVPEAKAAAILETFAAAARLRLAVDPHFEPLATPAPDRRALLARPSWDRIPTIFPFLLRRGGAYLAPEETAQVYRRLADLGCALGQPVACGSRDGAKVSALRLCASARLVARAGKTGGSLVAPAMAVLDKVAEAIGHAPSR